MFPQVTGRLRGRVWRPVDKLVVGALCLLLVAGLAVVALSLASGDEDGCGDGLRRTGPAKECVGVSEGDHVFAPELEELIQGVREENERVRAGWEDPEDGKASIPYVRVALMMPMTRDASSAMTMDLIKNALAGAYTAQLRANEDSGLRYQLLLANDGKDLDLWEPVVEQLADLTDDESPLVAVMGFPSSAPETQAAAEELSRHKIPSLGPVLTSSDMSADYLFKTSASNEHFALALERYLAEQPGSGKGFLVWDSRKQDNYAVNLREVFTEHFDADYGLRKRNASYLGETGEDAGIPQRFSSIAQKICLTEADTVFFAGRDRDLPALVSQLAGQASCEHEKPIRIMKIGIGRDPVFTDPTTTELLRKARIVTVGSVDVDPRWWDDGKGEPPGFAAFHSTYRTVEKKLGLDPKALDDGYTIMYHDAFTAAVQATDESYTAANDGEDGRGGGNGPEKRELRMPTKDDVFNSLINMSVLGTDDGTDCVNCIRGASGTFGFDAAPETDKWPVCRPVPVVEYPADTPARGGEKEYRTHEDIFDGECL
ncbi:ABC transporter substrate-binding protein [Streptomyces sp. NPDC054784]